jgi:hypothetical protein
MNTITKFERYKTQVFNGQDFLKNHFLSKNPIIYTVDTNDYSKATEFQGTSDYVWLINPNIVLSHGFPLWVRPPVNKPDVGYEFPYVHLESGNVKSWDMVKLVPTTGVVNTFERKYVICGRYDIYCGKKSFDMFYVGDKSDETYLELSEKHPNLSIVDDVSMAFKQSTTDMFWIIPSGIKILNDFNFDLIPHERAYEYPHVFGNGEIDTHTGVVLMPKSYIPTNKELEHNFYVKKRIIRKIVSVPY